MDECADHVNKVLGAHGQAFTNMMNDEQLVIAKTNMQEENESAAETSRRLNQTASRKLVSWNHLPNCACMFCVYVRMYVYMYVHTYVGMYTMILYAAITL